MKPRSKPGKIGTSGRAARAGIAGAKSLTEGQMEHLREGGPILDIRSKEGKGGRRAHWDIDYEQGEIYAKKRMPYRDDPSREEDGVRKTPKNGG